MPSPRPPPPLTRSPSTQRGLVAAIACIAVFGVAQSMTHPLFALLLEQKGLAALLIGLNASMPAIAALTLAPLMPRMIAALGLPLFLTGAAVIASGSLLLFPVWDNYWYWTGLRFVQGGAATALFLGSEAWIINSAEEGSRGRVIGLYGTILSLGFAAGPMLLTGVGFNGWAPFVVAAIGSLLCILPLITAWNDAPDARGEGTPDIPTWRFFLTDPTVIGGVVLFGGIEFGALALIPVWGVRTGLDLEQATFLLAILTLGGVIFQIPLGALADRWNRRLMLAFCASTCLAAAALLPLLAGLRWPLWSMVFLWGGLVPGLYTIALVELGSRYRGKDLVAANAAVITAYGCGALVGPLLVGAAMDVVSPHGFSVAVAVMAALYLGLITMRARSRLSSKPE